MMANLCWQLSPLRNPVKCDCPYDTARDIASTLSERSESTIESTEIRKYVLSELRSREASSAADAWETYDSEKKSS